MKLEQGARAPWYYGFAWYDPMENRTVVFPVPLNWLARWGLRFWWLARGVHGPTTLCPICKRPYP